MEEQANILNADRELFTRLQAEYLGTKEWGESNTLSMGENRKLGFIFDKKEMFMVLCVCVYTDKK